MISAADRLRARHRKEMLTQDWLAMMPDDASEIMVEQQRAEQQRQVQYGIAESLA